MSDQEIKNVVKMPNSKFIALIVIILAILLVGLNSFYTVSPQEKAVVLNFGKYYTTNSSGFHFKLPFVQKVYKVNTEETFTMPFGFVQQSGIDSVIRTDVEESLLLTGDSNILDIRWSIDYKITDPKNWLFNVDSNSVRDDRGRLIDNREKTIRDISLSVINNIIGNSSLNRIFEGNRSTLVSSAKDIMNEKLQNVGLGVTVQKVEFNTVAAPPGGVQEAFSDVTAATVEKNTLIDQGNVYRSKELPKVKGEVDKIKALADGYALQRVNLANGDVAKFKAIYEEYRKNPSITRKRMYYETMEYIVENSDKTDLIDKDLTNFIPFKSMNIQGGNQ